MRGRAKGRGKESEREAEMDTIPEEARKLPAPHPNPGHVLC